MNFRRYLGTIVLVAAAFVSQSCSDSSGASQNPTVTLNADKPPSGSIVGFLSLYTSPVTLPSAALDWQNTRMAPKGMTTCDPPCSGSYTPPTFDWQNTLAFWEGEDIEVPDPIVNFECRVMNLASPLGSRDNAIPGTNMVQYVGYSVPGTSMSQSELVAVMAASNIAILNPDQENIRLVPLTKAALNNTDKNPLLSFESFETEALRPPQGSPKMHGPLYRGKYKNVDRIPSGSYQLHVDSEQFGVIDLPIDIDPFELKNGDSKMALKPQDFDVRKDVHLEWPFEWGQKGTVVLTVYKRQRGTITGNMFCLFPNVGRATISAEKMEDFAKISGRTSDIQAFGHTGKTISIQQNSWNILLYIQHSQSYGR